MDIKHVLSRNPLQPAYLAGPPEPAGIAPPKAGWIEHDGGPVEIGHRGQVFGFDNEFPVHTVHLTPFGLADRPVTCGDWLSFMEDDGYSPARILAVRRVGRGQRAAVGLAPLLVPRRRRPRAVAPVHALGPPTGRSERADLPHQLLRSGCVRPLDRHAAPHRIGVGDDRPVRRRRRQLPARRRSLERARHTRGPRSHPMPSSATPGSGPRARTRRTPASGLPRAPWASTTGNSWSVSTCCVAGVAPPRPVTSGPRIATSSRRARAGRSAGSVWPGTPEPWRTRSTSISRPRKCGARCSRTR